MTNYIHSVLQMEELLLGLSYLFNIKEDSRIAAQVFILASLNFSNEAVFLFFMFFKQKEQELLPQKSVYF